MAKSINGFTLIEMLLFIIIIGLVTGALSVGFQTVLRGTQIPVENMIATEVVKNRLELINLYCRVNGFNSCIDPCTIPANARVCGLPTGYNATVTVNGSAQTKTFQAVISGTGSASATLEVWNG